MDYKITFNLAQESHLPFIYKSWLMGAFHGNRAAKGAPHNTQYPIDYLGSIEQDVFMKEYHKFIESKIFDPDTHLRVACLENDPDVILGYSVSKGPVLYWVHVKPDWRNIGIARDLVPRDITICASLTRIGDAIRRKRGWTFNPWS